MFNSFSRAYRGRHEHPRYAQRRGWERARRGKDWNRSLL